MTLFSKNFRQVIRSGLVSVGFVGLVAGCKTEQHFVQVFPAPAYRGLYLTVPPLKKQPFESTLLSFNFPPPDKKEDPLALAKNNAVGENQSSVKADSLSAVKREGSYTASQPTNALDVNTYYASIQEGYKPEDTDTPKMKEFKAMKDSLDKALVKAGYNQEQIKRFYVLNYISAQQANAHKQTAPGSALNRTPEPASKLNEPTFKA